MGKWIVGVVLVLVLALVASAPVATADDGSDEIGALKAQVQELLKRIEKLEQNQAKAKEEVTQAKEAAAKAKEDAEKAKAQAPVAPRVDLEKVASKLKLKGRWAAGYYKSEEDGSYRSGSFEAPEGKIQFTFEPDDINKIIMRMNLNNATFNNVDYFYMQSKLSKFLDWPFDLNARLGRFKLGFGEETWSDNPVESVLPSNSAAKSGGVDEGVELAGKLQLDKIGLRPLGWVASISDGNSGVGSDTGKAKAFMGKLYYTPIEPLYLSATYYNSGSLKASNAEIGIASLNTRPSGATSWEREMWEVDLRYDFGKGKSKLNPPAYSDSKAFIRLAYGQLSDEVKAGTGTERDADFGFVEGTYNLTKKLYAAARYSIVDLDGTTTTASLNSVDVNKYQRYSLGGGYRWSENTILKLGYDWNDESGSGVTESDNDLLSAIVASQF